MMERLSRIRQQDLDVIDRFLRVPDWRKRITAVVVMTASPADSLDREQGCLPIVGATPSIMNLDVLQQMLNTINATVDRLKNEFRIRLVDTSSTELKGNLTKTVETVADVALDIIEEQLREEILFAPKAEIAAVFDQRISLRSAEADAVMQCFSKHGEFLPRDQVERNPDVVQALPVVIVRNKSGAILRLRRKESSRDNPLHEKLVIWAGGHVRSEDGSNGEAIVRCAVRELQEELPLALNRPNFGFWEAFSSKRVSVHPNMSHSSTNGRPKRTTSRLCSAPLSSLSEEVHLSVDASLPWTTLSRT